MSDLAITVDSKETSAPGSRMQPANHSAWLEQLESAQWQQRLRYQPNNGSGQQRSSDAASDSLREQAPFRSTAAVSTGANAPVDTRRQATGMAESTANGMARASLNSGTVRAANMQPTAALLPTSPQPLPTLGDELDRTMAPQARRLLAMQWQARNAHVMLSAEGLRVWLRDTRYREGDGQKLLRALRSQFAHTGLRLAQFTLNGSQISEPNRID